MISRVLLTSFVVFSIFLFSGCAGKSGEQGKEAAEAAATEAAAAEQVAQDPCEAEITTAVAQARETMRIATKSCQDRTIEATPVWGLNYKGAVHVRVYDSSGTLIEDKYVQP
jgi:hypothetical protein